MEKKRSFPVIAGIVLCILTLALSVVLQKEGYLTYLNSDMAAEIILAREQADTGHLIETQWMHSTEIHTLHMNLLYAFAFLFTDSYFAARIIGNTIGFLLGIASYVYLCRKLKVSYSCALCTAALLPLAASLLYAANMTVAGYYIVHLSFAYLGAGLWLSSAQHAKRRGKGLFLALGFMAFCALEGLMSVRYVLCFACPMLVTGALDMIFAPEERHSLMDEHERFFGITVLGFMACVAGYVLSEIVYPHVFVSAVGAASSFQFNPLDGSMMLDTLLAVFTDFLKLLGWRGGVALFSLEGIVNLCVAAMIVLGVVMSVRVYRALTEKDAASRAQKRMMRYAVYAFLVNLFCFLFIKGTYVNRYLIVAILFFVPMLAVVLHREKNRRLWCVFILVLGIGLGTSSMVQLRDTVRQERAAQEKGQQMMAAADYLLENGYTHGYGTFWQVRVMQELTEGELTFTVVAPDETEPGAVASEVLGLKRWGEMARMSELDVCPEKTFLMLTPEESERLAQWIGYTQAPVIFENSAYVVYGFESSQAFSMAMQEGRMTLENAQALGDGVYQLGSEGRLRMPPAWREAGIYTLSFTLEGDVQADSVARIHSGKEFTVITEQPLVAGENSVSFTLEHDDKYLLMQIRAGAAEGLQVSDLAWEKAPDQD